MSGSLGTGTFVIARRFEIGDGPLAQVCENCGGKKKAEIRIVDVLDVQETGRYVL